MADKNARVDRTVSQAALEVYKNLDSDLQDEVDDFLRLVFVGKAPGLESFDRELYDAYEPVRKIVRRRHGSMVKLYRGEPKDKPPIKRKFLSWTPSWKLATHFAGSEDYEIVEADVKTSDIVAVFVSPHNVNYIEYLVRDRKEYHERQSEEQVPFMGFIGNAADGKELGFPKGWDFDPEHARREFPKIERAVRAIGGKVIGKFVNEEDEGASVTVLIPPTLETIKRDGKGEADSATIGPYYVDTLRPVVGQSLRERVAARFCGSLV